jgi:hypothetical protein
LAWQIYTFCWYSAIRLLFAMEISNCDAFIRIC